MAAESPKFCSDCGASLQPLKQIHIQKPCQECGRQQYVKPARAEGGGITVEAGSTLKIPAGFLRLSLGPDGNMKFYKPGLALFTRMQIWDGQPKQSNEIDGLIDRYKEIADKILEESSLLEGLNLNEEKDADEAMKKIAEKKETKEWWAVLMAANALEVREAIKNKNPLEAAFAMFGAVAAHSMVVIKGDFEDTLWRGYLANQVIYNAAAAASRDPIEAEAIRKLEPFFSRQPESLLHNLVESGLPIGPRIGIKELPEEMLKALAKWHLVQFQRLREEEKITQQQKQVIRDTWIKGIGVGVAVAGLLVSILKSVGIL